MVMTAPSRIGRTRAVQERTDHENLRLELAVRDAELHDDLAVLVPAADLFVSIAHEYSPSVHQRAIGMRRRVARMQARLAGDGA